MSVYIYFLLFFIILFSFFVIFSRSVISSVLFLILVYLLVALFFMWLGVEFLSIILFIIYVGAISVLFLFVVMLLNLRSLELFNNFYNYIPVGGFIGVFFFVEIFYLFFFNYSSMSKSLFFEDSYFNLWFFFWFFKSNIYNFGLILYNYYWFYVCVISIILLIAMLGSIIMIVVELRYKKFFMKNEHKDRFFKRLCYYIGYRKRKIFLFFKYARLNFLEKYFPEKKRDTTVLPIDRFYVFTRKEEPSPKKKYYTTLASVFNLDKKKNSKKQNDI